MRDKTYDWHKHAGYDDQLRPMSICGLTKMPHVFFVTTELDAGVDCEDCLRIMAGKPEVIDTSHCTVWVLKLNESIWPFSGTIEDMAVVIERNPGYHAFLMTTDI